MENICGVIDFDGFQVTDRFLVREFGCISMESKFADSFRYNLSRYTRDLTQKDWGNIRYVEKRIFGLPFHPLRGEPVGWLEDLDEDLMEFYESCRTPARKVIAYKGGSYEKDRLDSLDIPSVNLESFGCPKFDKLKCEKYDSLTCGYHTRNLHCPKAEVTAFRDWIQAQIRKSG